MDESLSHFVADAFQMVDYPITSCVSQGLAGWPDTDLIPWMAERGYIWVTKDDDARTRHRSEILQTRISVVWLRGEEGPNATTVQGTIIRKQQHRLLADLLDDIGEVVARSRGPRYFMAYLRNGRPAMRNYPTLERFGR